MPGYSIFLIASLVTAGALIAYLGDYIGRRLGRRRATVFGLRPRQTARLVSVLAGISISGVTIGISIQVSSDVRAAFFQAETLRRNNEALSHSLETVQSQVDSAQGDLARMSQQRDATAGQLGRAVTQREVVSRRLQTARERLAGAQKRLADAGNRLQAADDRLATIDRQLATVHDELSSARAALANASEDLGRYQQQLDVALQHERELRQERESLEKEITGLQDERERLQKQVVTLTPYVRGKLTFLLGEEVSRHVAPRQLSLSDAIAQVRAIVAETESLAVARGAQANADGRTAICVGEKTGVSLDDIMREVADSIVSSPQDMVVQIKSAANCVEGQPLVFEFGLFMNYLLFSRGQAMRSMQVDSSLDQAEIFQQLGRLLGDAASLAFRHGVLASERPPYSQELFNAVSEIKDMGGRPTTLVLAAQDIWTAGPLALELRVEAGER